MMERFWRRRRPPLESEILGVVSRQRSHATQPARLLHQYRMLFYYLLMLFFPPPVYYYPAPGAYFSCIFFFKAWCSGYLRIMAGHGRTRIPLVVYRSCACICLTLYIDLVEPSFWRYMMIMELGCGVVVGEDEIKKIQLRQFQPMCDYLHTARLYCRTNLCTRVSYDSGVAAEGQACPSIRIPGLEHAVPYRVKIITI